MEWATLATSSEYRKGLFKFLEDTLSALLASSMASSRQLINIWYEYTASGRDGWFGYRGRDPNLEIQLGARLTDDASSDCATRSN